MHRKPSSSVVRIAILVLLSPWALTWLAAPAFPQAASGTIRGTVTDPSGAVIPNASVLVTNVQTGVRLRSVSNSSGLYEARFLSPGAYTVTVEASGFVRSIQSNLSLHIGQVIGLNVRLQVGQATQSVVVQGGAVQMLQPDTSNVSQVINHQQVTDLPLNGRDFMDLIALSAGATPGLQGQSIGNYNLNGQRSDQNNFMLEGIDDMNIEGSPVNKPSVDAVQEFQVQTANYSAEFGRAAGGIVQVELRSGTNRLHGSVFEFVRNDKLDANGFFNNQVPPNAGEAGAPKSELRRNQFGFTLGGPIRKDKLFFFGDYQGSRQVESDSEIFSVPTLAERQGNFSQTLAPGTPIYQNALLGTVYPGCDLSNFTSACQVVPTSAMDPAAIKVAQFYPAPNIPGEFVQGVGTFANYAANGRSANNQDSFDFKIDYHLNDKDSLSTFYSFGRSDSVIPAAFGNNTIGPCINCGIVLNLLAGSNLFRNQSGGVTEVHSFSPAVVNEFRAGFNRTYNPYATADGGQDLASQFGIGNVNVDKFTGGLPWFDFSPAPDWIGTSPFLPFIRGGTTYQFTDNLSIVRGKNQIKAGVSIIRRLDNNHSNFFPRGGYIFAPFFTGNAFADFLTGRALAITQDLTPGTIGERGIEYAGYVQDDLKVNTQLTLNLGVRYELYPGYVEAYNRNSNLNLNTGTVILAGQNGNPRSFVPTEYKNWAPRLGFAYSLGRSGKTVLRGGYGISYFNSGDYFDFSAVNPPYTGAFTLFNLDPNTIDAQYLISDGLPVQLRPSPATFDPKNPSGNWTVNSPNSRTPYSEFYSFGIQRALPGDVMIGISYVGATGVKLPGEVEGNPAPPGPTTTVDQRRIRYGIMPNVQAVTLIANAFSSNYNSLQVKSEKRFSHGLQFLATYTYGKSIDNLSGSPLTGGGDSNPSSAPQDPFNLRLDRARSGYDQTHRFVMAFDYDLPFGRGHAFGGQWGPLASGLLGGWQTNGIVTLSSGLPFTVFASSSANCGCSVGDLRADRLANGNLPPDKRSPNGWFDKAAFTDPPSSGPTTGGGAYGNAGRNIIDGPGYAGVDFSMFKKFRIREKVELQFRGEVFNLFNRTNFFYPSNPNNATWQSGGIITQSYPSRQVQLALKILF